MQFASKPETKIWRFLKDILKYFYLKNFSLKFVFFERNLFQSYDFNRLKRVYASPSKRELSSKGTEEIITYPFIYFIIDYFDKAFNEMVVKENEMVCKELVANDGRVRKVLFLGSIKYEALKKVYDTRVFEIISYLKT